MQTATRATQGKSASQHQVLEQVRQVLLSLGPPLQEAAAVGVCGSLVRPGDWTERSDIDIFVVVEHLKPGGETDRLWWYRVRDALDAFNRDVNVLVYSRRGLEMISNWYVLRLASEGVLVYDGGGIAQLFAEIRAAAMRAGLVEDEIDGMRYWHKKEMRLGEIFEVKVR
jgi:predicted nucleotidyltransferase